MELNQVIKKLKDNSIPFYVTGSYAVELYTDNKKNSDIDFCLRKNDLPKVFQLFPNTRKVFKKESKSIFKSLRFENYEFSAYDYFESGRTFELDEIIPKCELMRVEGYTCDVISIEDLIMLKLSLHRISETKNDYTDVKELINTREISKFSLLLQSLKWGLVGKLIFALLDKSDGIEMINETNYEEIQSTSN